MSQEVKKINLADLVLWTENPRDPIDSSADDQKIVDKAITDTRSKWNLSKLAKEMGAHYDFSELPTVVYQRGKPIVYDGNRRVILGKIKYGMVAVNGFDPSEVPAFPIEIPCNVCSKDIALDNVYRKHAETGSWLPLERDIFLHKHMKKEKSPFLIIEENTGLISAEPHLNQRFVKEEIFSEDVLKKLGMVLDGNSLLSKHNADQTIAIFEDLSRKIKEKKISTRHNRGKVIDVLDPDHQQLVADHKKRPLQQVDLRTRQESVSETKSDQQRKSRRTKTTSQDLFGGPLYLRIGGVSNLYRDIADLYSFYIDRKQSLSEVFPSLIRMALRLLCEAAAKDCAQTMDQYLKARFASAKSTLDQDAKTSLSNHNVTESSIVQLLHTGAHNYSASANVDQTIAVSIILGAILANSHGKVEKT
jgi:hypothetical protein